MGLGVVVRSDRSGYEIVSDFLWSHGVAAITETWNDDGSVILRTSLGEDREAIRGRLNDLPTGEWSFEMLDDSAGDEWRRHAVAIPIGERLIVVPAWIDESSGNRTVVAIEPGPTFGLGDHPTTRGCLALLERIGVAGRTVLDVGCGSGVLGITALVLGARVAHGIDVMPAADETSVANAVRNRVGERWTVQIGSLSDVSTTFDVVVANILAPVLVDLADDLRRVTASGGTLILSGVLDGAYGHVLDALAPHRKVDGIVIDGWATVAVSFADSVDE